MKNSYHLIAGILIIGVAQFIFLPSHSFAESQTIEVTQERVKEVCGEDLQDNGKGVMGCSQAGCRSNAVCDYSCGGPEGEGCRLNVMEAKRKLKLPTLNTSKIPLKE
jgi:hypothetical protein